MIDEKTLRSSNAEMIKMDSGEVIFREGELPEYYYQILAGSVKLFNKGVNDNELVQAIISKGYAIGDFALLADSPYPTNAEAITEVVLLRLSRDAFFKLSEASPEIGLSMAKSMSDLIYFKFVMGNIYLMKAPSQKLVALMDHLKARCKDKRKFSLKIILTRQQMANLTGMRVETTIRALKQMESEGLVKIIDRKVFY